MRSSTLSLVLAVLTGSSHALLSKPALFPNLDKFGPKLQELPKTSLEVSRWTSGRMPKGCRDEIIRNNRKPTDFEVFTLKMGDCAEEWYICQENNAPLSIQEVSDNFARIPVRMRQWVQNVIHFKEGGGAYQYAGFIGMFGRSASTGIFFHETTHAVDLDGGFHLEQKGLSSSKIWLDAYDQDSAVPDEYARNNQIENLAQFPGLIVYDRFTNGALQKENGIGRIGHQLQTAADQGDWENKYGGRLYDLNNKGLKCTRRYKEQLRVDRATGEPRPNGKRDGVRNRSDDILYMDPPDVSTALQSNCTGLN